MQKDYSIGAFKNFLETLGDDSDMNTATARNLKNTSLLLINSYVDDVFIDDETDIRNIETDAMIKDHFRNAENEPSSATVQVYKSRYQSAKEKFIEKIDGVSSVESNSVGRVRRSKVIFNNGPSRERIKANQVTVLNKDVRGDVSTIDIPIPLRPDMILTLPGIPTDLTNEEAERIASIVKVYARP